MITLVKRFLSWLRDDPPRRSGLVLWPPHTEADYLPVKTAALYGGPADGETIPLPPILIGVEDYVAFNRRYPDPPETHRYASTGRIADGHLVLVYLGRIE